MRTINCADITAAVKEMCYEACHYLTPDMKDALVKAEAADVAKSDFLARMSHEIRNPINGILGMTEMILMEAEGENIKEYAANARNSSNTLLRIINDILDFSKVDGEIDIAEVALPLAIRVGPSTTETICQGIVPTR